MNSELIVNVTSSETRVALLENGILAELHIERESDKGIAGNIYKGRVQRVLPGMQAAFVEIGLARSAFLYVDDVYSNNREYAALFTVFQEEQENTEVGDAPAVREQIPSKPIEDMLSDGQEIMVQVIKEPLGGAHVDPEEAAKNIKTTVKKYFVELMKIPKDELIVQRYKKFRGMGKFEEGS